MSLTGAKYADMFNEQIGKLLGPEDVDLLAFMIDSIVNDSHLKTKDEILDVVADRHDEAGEFYFFCYDDDEGTDDVYFSTNITQDDFEMMVDLYREVEGWDAPDWDDDDDDIY